MIEKSGKIPYLPKESIACLRLFLDYSAECVPHMDAVRDARYLRNDQIAPFRVPSPEESNVTSRECPHGESPMVDPRPTLRGACYEMRRWIARLDGPMDNSYHQQRTGQLGS